MGPDDDANDVVSAPERRLVELLGMLTAEVVVSRADLSGHIARRARRQQETRTALLLGAGVLAAVVTGLAGLLPSRDVRGDGG